MSPAAAKALAKKIWLFVALLFVVFLRLLTDSRSVTLVLIAAALLLAVAATLGGRWALARYRLSPGAAFAAILAAAFVVGSAAKFHGSSADRLVQEGLTNAGEQPLLGTGRGIRADEFVQHSPTILYQINRKDPFAVNSSTGPGASILIANAPTQHWTMLFRPQFWAFFILPADYAFAVYWQWKMLLLLAGTFLAFRVLTGVSELAVFGSIWFFFSAYTQWAYSWPALLPEMIGLACLAFASACWLFQAGPGIRAILAPAILLVWTTVNFALCAYPPFQIPIGYAALALFLAWLVRRRQAAGSLVMMPGLARVAGALTISAIITGVFCYEIRDVIQIASQTDYPGRRRLDGGYVPWTLLVSGFLDPLKSEGSVPPGFLNICESSGFLWFAPATLFFTRRLPAGAWLLFLFVGALVCWMVLPIPAWVGHYFLLDLVLGFRVTPALGILNIALTLLFLRDVPARNWPAARIAITAAACVAVSIVVLWLTNATLKDFFPYASVVACGIGAGVAATALAAGQRRVFALLILAPLIWLNALVNPVQRGLRVFEMSDLRQFVQTHRPFQGSWLVFSENHVAGPFLSSFGLDVVNCFQYVPRLADWRQLDPTGGQTGFYNGSGYTIVSLAAQGATAGFASVEYMAPPFIRRLRVEPSDPRLREIGIRYFAFHGVPPEDAFPAGKFELMTPQPVQGFTIYKTREP